MYRPTSVSLLCTLILIALVLGPDSAFAEDTATETDTPAARFAAKVQTLPTPTPELGFVFEGTARMGGRVLGPVRFAAEAVMDGERAAWRVSDKLAFSGGKFRTHQIAILGSDLNLIRGEEAGVEPGNEAHKSQFVRTEQGLQAKYALKGGEAVESTHAIEGPCVITLASLLLFARLATPEDGKAGDDYAMTIFDPTHIADEKPTMQPGTISLAGMGKWNGVNAYIVTAVKNNKGKVRIAIDPKTKDILGFELAKPGTSVPIVFTQGADDTAEPAAEEAFWTQHPKTAKQAALQAAYAFASGDVDMLDRLFNWNAIYDALPETERDGIPTATALRETVMSNFRLTLKRQADPAMLRAMLPSAPLKEEALENGNVKLVFPPQLKNLTLITAAINGRWYVIRMPSQ